MPNDVTGQSVPSLDEFLAEVAPLNPDATSAQLIQAYESHFGVKAPAQETRATLPSFEEFRQEVKPLNPGTSEEEIRQVWQDKFGVMGAREHTPTFMESLKQGMSRGYEGVKEEAAGIKDRFTNPNDPAKKFAREAGDLIANEAKKYAVPSDLEDKSLWERFTNPEYLGNFIGNMMVESAPSLGGAVAGGTVGGAVAGPPGAVLGAAAGMGGTTFFQEAGKSYREAYEKYKAAGQSDAEAHENAYQASGISGAISGMVNSLAVPASLMSPAKGLLKNLFMRYVANVAIDTGDQYTGNLVAKHTYDPERSATEGVAEAAIGSGLFGAPETMAGVQAAVRAQRSKPDQGILPPTAPTPGGGQPGATSDSTLRKDPLEVAKPITNTTTVDDAIKVAKGVTDEIPIDLDKLKKEVGDEVEVEKQAAKVEAETISRKAQVEADQDSLDTIGKYNPKIRGAAAVDPETLPETAPPDKPHGLTKPQYDALADLISLDGTRLVPYSGLTRNAGFVVSDLDQKTAWINTGSKYDPAFIAFHEVQHIMQKSEIFDQYREVVLEELKPGATTSARRQHGNLNKEKIFDEILSDIHGDAMTRESFHQKLISKLEAQDGASKTQTKLTQFLDKLKELIARVRDHLTDRQFVNAEGKRVVENYVNNIERVHDALAAAMAEHYRTRGLAAELPVPKPGEETYMKAGTERVVVHPDAINAFHAISDQRLGAPKSAVNAVLRRNNQQDALVAMSTSNIIHDVTDASHLGHANQARVKERIQNAIKGIGPRATLDPKSKKEWAAYGAEHAKIPVYNDVQWLAREAAIALGENRPQDARAHLTELKKLADSPDFNKRAFEFKRDGAGKLAPHLREVEGEMIIEKGAKEPKFKLKDGREVTQSEMQKTRQRVKTTKLQTREEVTKREEGQEKRKETGLLEDKRESAPGRTYEEIQKEIDAVEERLEKSGVDTARMYDPKDPQSNILAGYKDYKPMPEELAKLYRERYVVEKRDKTEFFEKSVQDTGLPRAEAEGALRAIYLDPKNLTATFSDMLKRWNTETTQNLTKLYNHFLANKYIDQNMGEDYNDKFARFIWGGTAENPKVEVSTQRGHPPEQALLNKVERVYNAVAKNIGANSINLQMKSSDGMRLLVGTSIESRIPKGMTVDTKALRESTGEMIDVKEDAKVALQDVEESISKYTKLLECLQS